jgi:hypothetical protein
MRPPNPPLRVNATPRVLQVLDWRDALDSTRLLNSAFDRSRNLRIAIFERVCGAVNFVLVERYLMRVSATK